jgi:hypothetical protein
MAGKKSRRKKRTVSLSLFQTSLSYRREGQCKACLVFWQAAARANRPYLAARFAMLFDHLVAKACSSPRRLSKSAPEPVTE